MNTLPRTPLLAALLLLLSPGLGGCEQEPERAPTSEERCEPAVDLEVCDGDGRLQCDVVSRSWVFIGACESQTHCVQSPLEGPQRAKITRCDHELER